MVKMIRLEAVLGVFFLALPQVACTGLRARAQGDDDGDAGGAGGMGGALRGLMGGGGGGDDDSGGDDDDANLVDSHGKKAVKVKMQTTQKSSGNTGGVDVDGLEKGLESGGIGQLTMMLKTMQAAKASNEAGAHIVKMKNGEEMYDFRDLDDENTTPKPLQLSVTDKPPTMPSPAIAVPMATHVALPSARDAAKAALSGGQRRKIVVWTPKIPVASQLAATQPLQPMPLAALLPANTLPVAGAMPLAQVAPASSSATAALYQGLGMLRQNMDIVMGEAGQMAANAGQMQAKIDHMSDKFDDIKADNVEMHKEMKVLEQTNAEMRTQVEAQAEEVKAMQKVGKRALRKAPTEDDD